MINFLRSKLFYNIFNNNQKNISNEINPTPKDKLKYIAEIDKTITILYGEKTNQCRLVLDKTITMLYGEKE